MTCLVLIVVFIIFVKLIDWINPPVELMLFFLAVGFIVAVVVGIKEEWSRPTRRRRPRAYRGSGLGILFGKKRGSRTDLMIHRVAWKPPSYVVKGKRKYW